jgi:hypothetical protein
MSVPSFTSMQISNLYTFIEVMSCTPFMQVGHHYTLVQDCDDVFSKLEHCKIWSNIYSVNSVNSVVK